MKDNLWEQHRQTYRVGGCVLRHLRFMDYMRTIESAGFSEHLINHLQYLETKSKLGEELEQEEAQELVQISARMPTEEMYAACFVIPVIEDAVHLNVFLYSLPADERATIRVILEKMIEAQPRGGSGLQNASLLGAAGIPMSRDLDFTNITVQQALTLFSSLAEAAKKAKEAKGQGVE